jgi:signal peptidase I
VVPPDSYFLLGDNRPSSKDSRQWGPLRRSQIIAVALRITAPAARAGAIAGSPR